MLDALGAQPSYTISSPLKWGQSYRTPAIQGLKQDHTCQTFTTKITPTFTNSSAYCFVDFLEFGFFFFLVENNTSYHLPRKERRNARPLATNPEESSLCYPAQGPHLSRAALASQLRDPELATERMMVLRTRSGLCCLRHLS